MNKKPLPGEIICDEEDFIRGHGTQKINEAKKIHSTIYGSTKVINKLISVIPINNLHYQPEIGDVVVGRVTEILQKKWKIKINSDFATLNLSSITLPNLEQRKKIESDEIRMREYFDLNDVLVAEVQKVNKGRIALHTRNEKYRKLTYGILIELAPCLIKRMKSCFIESEDIEVIIGMNGSVYVGGKFKSHIVFEKVGKVINYLEECKNEMKIINYEEIVNIIE